MDPSYHFKTEWLIAAPVAAVYPLIHNAESWPLWWPSVRKVTAWTAKDGTERQRQHWRTPFGYSFAFDLKLLERIPNQRLHAAASGMLVGTGTWRFEEAPEGCLLSFEWKVKTKVGWMNALGFLLRPVFQYNHYLVMKQGRKGMEKMLGRQKKVESG